MPNYSELYSLPSVSALSLPHYNSGTLSYLNYSKPLSRYPGVYKPHLSTISEINSSYRRLNSPKLTFPADISSRHNIKPIKVINTADIDVSVNKYKKYEKKSRLKSVEPKNPEPEQKESTPKPAIRRDRATVRIKTVHTDTVKEEIGAFKTWRDNFEPSELVNEVKTRKKTKGEILKEKFLIRSRSKENIPLAKEASRKIPIKKTSSFRDICTAITSENITDDLNPGQPVDVQRRQSKQLSENLLKDIRRVSVELTDEDFSLLNTILSTQEEENDTSESSEGSLKSDIGDSDNISVVEKAESNVTIKDKSKLVVGDDNNNINEIKEMKDSITHEDGECSKNTKFSKSKLAVSDDNNNNINEIKDNITLKNGTKLGDTSKNTKLYKSKLDVDDDNNNIKKIKVNVTLKDGTKLGESSKNTKLSISKLAVGDNNINEIKDIKNNIIVEDGTKLEESSKNSKLSKSKSPVGEDNNEIKDNFTVEDGVKSRDSSKNTKLSKSKSDFLVSNVHEAKKNKFNEIIPTKSVPNVIKQSKNEQLEYKIGKVDILKRLPSEVEKFIDKNQIAKKELMADNKNAEDVKNIDISEKIKSNTVPVRNNEVSEVSKPKIDITNVEIQQIKFKTKPIITSSVDDIKKPKKTLVAVVDNVEVQKTPTKIEKKLKFNVTVKVDETNKKIKKNENLQRATIKQGKLFHPATKKYLENVIVQKINSRQKCKELNQIEDICNKKSVPENNINEQAEIDVKKTKTDEVNQSNDETVEKVNQSKDETVEEVNQSNDETVEENTKKSTKITSKRSLLNKSVKEDPDLMVFVAPPEEERQPETTEDKKDVFVPLQSNRLTKWMHPWAKPEQFDECPVEIFARPKIIRGRHYPRPRKRNSNGVSQVPANSVDDDSSTSDSDDSSTEDTSASLRSNDSGFGSTVPEKINILQQESVTDKFDTSDNQTDLFVPPDDGKIIPPATTLPRFKKYCVEDFDFLKVIGKGSFGKVLLSKLKGTDYYYAVKCLKKDVIIEDDDVECTLIERKVLALGTKHPFLCHLLCTLQTESHLFFVMEYLNGGDLMFHITTRGSFPEDEARFYSAEIISGLQFLHSKGIIYRDLKLDNVLLDFDGHARLADFGMCQLQIFLDRMAESFCGTPDYMAPEIIKGQHYNQAVDWWSFGVLLYELFLGQSPFSGCDEDELFWSICNEKPVFPKHLSTYAIDLLTLLMEKDHTKRLGTRFSPHGSIRDHDFYRKLDWQALEARQIEPPFKPNVCHPLDTQYFDTNFTKETVKLSPTEVQKLQSIDQSQFQGFSYTNPNATDR